MKQLLQFALLLLALPVSLAAECSNGSVVLNISGTPTTFCLKAPPVGGFFDGAGGALTTALQNSTSTGRANTNDPAWPAVLNDATTWVGTNQVCNAPSVPNQCLGSTTFGSNGEGDRYPLKAAVAWWAQGANVSDPNGLLAAAKGYFTNDLQTGMSGEATPPGCDEVVGSSPCGTQGHVGYELFATPLGADIANAYAAIRGQLTTTQRQVIANTIFNDNDTTENGLNPSGSACNKSAYNLIASGNKFTTTITVSPSVPTITTTGGFSTNVLLVPGASIWAWSTTYVAWEFAGYVESVTNDTTLALTSTVSGEGISGFSTSSWAVLPPLNYAAVTDACGLIWAAKHYQYFPAIPIATASSSPTYYPTTGQSEFPGNIGTGFAGNMFALAVAFAQDDTRAQLLATQIWDWATNSGPDYYHGGVQGFPLLAYAREGFTGANFSGSQYGFATTPIGYIELQAVLNNSFVSPPTALAPEVAQSLALLKQTSLPDFSNRLPWYVSQTAADGGSSYQQYAIGYMAAWLNPVKAESQYFLGSFAGGTSGTCGWPITTSNVNYAGYNAITNFMGYDPAQATLSCTAEPTQYMFGAPELTYAQCVSAYGASNCVNGQVWQLMASRSGWGPTADVLIVDGGFISQGWDHETTVDQGVPRIFVGDDSLFGCDTQTSVGEADTGGALCSLPTNGEAYSLSSATSIAPMLRWGGGGGTVQGYGDAASRYAYTRLDFTNGGAGGLWTSGNNPTRANRDIVDLKEGSDYYIEYDDVAQSTAATLGTYLHWVLPTNGAYTSATITPASFAGKVVNGSAALLTVNVYPVESSNTVALTVQNSNGSYSGGNGWSARALACASTNGTSCNASATAFEALTVYQPCSGVGCTMPAVAQPTCTAGDGNCAVVQIADATEPKVWAFARQGATLSRMSFTSTHSGTAQYLVTGMAPGTYEVTNGSGSTSCTVAASDNTCYFESVAGAVTLAEPASTQFMLTTTSAGVSPTPYPPVLRGCCGNTITTIEPSRGTYSWTAFDAWRTAASSNGVQYMYTLQEIPYWMSGTSSGGSQPPSDISTTATCDAPISTVTTTDCQYKELITSIVQHVTGLSSTPGSPVNCPQLDYIEMMNEYDTDSSTGGAGTGFTGTYAQVATLSNDASTIIHAYCSNTKVVAGSVSSIVGSHADGESSHYDYAMATVLNDWYALASPSLPDAISLHIYCCRGTISPVPFPTTLASNSDATCPGTSNSSCYVAVKDQVNTLSAALPSWASALPIYSTEGGFGELSQLCGTTCSNTATDTIFLRAAYVAESMLLIASQKPSNGFVQMHMLYAAFDSTWGCYQNCGTSNSGWYPAFLQTQSWLNSATMALTPTWVETAVTGGNTWTLNVTVAGQAAQFAFFDGYQTTYNMATSFTTQQNLAGATSATGGTVTLSQQPMLLTSPGTPSNVPAAPIMLGATVQISDLMAMKGRP